MAAHLLDAIESMLQRDRHINNSVLAQIAYVWVDHLYKSALVVPASPKDTLQDQGAIHVFLQEKFLYWLEALSLCKSVSKGVVAIDGESNLPSLLV